MSRIPEPDGTVPKTGEIVDFLQMGPLLNLTVGQLISILGQHSPEQKMAVVVPMKMDDGTEREIAAPVRKVMPGAGEVVLSTR